MLELLASSGSAYLLITAFVAGDGVFPSVPGELALIGGAILAADHELSLGLVLCAGIVGGLIGDNASYLIGAKIGAPASQRLFRGQRSRSRLQWASDQLAEHGRVIILTGRFIPVGRTATTFSAGMLAMPWRRFVAIDAVAVLAWAFYASFAGYVGGRAFGLDGAAVLVGAVVLASLLGIGVELTRRMRARS
jgi:membrane protein DedA with SNARE-associated domain